MGGGQGAAGALRRSSDGAGSSVSAGAGDNAVGEGGGGALLQTLEEEAEFSGKAGEGVAKGSEGGKGGEPELRRWFIWMGQRVKRHNLDDITLLSAVIMNNVSLCSELRGPLS